MSFPRCGILSDFRSCNDIRSYLEISPCLDVEMLNSAHLEDTFSKIFQIFQRSAMASCPISASYWACTLLRSDLDVYSGPPEIFCTDIQICYSTGLFGNRKFSICCHFNEKKSDFNLEFLASKRKSIMLDCILNVCPLIHGTFE